MRLKIIFFVLFVYLFNCVPTERGFCLNDFNHVWTLFVLVVFVQISPSILAGTLWYFKKSFHFVISRNWALLNLKKTLKMSRFVALVVFGFNLINNFIWLWFPKLFSSVVRNWLRLRLKRWGQRGRRFLLLLLFILERILMIRKAGFWYTLIIIMAKFLLKVFVFNFEPFEFNDFVELFANNFLQTFYHHILFTAFSLWPLVLLDVHG